MSVYKGNFTYISTPKGKEKTKTVALIMCITCFSSREHIASCKQVRIPSAAIFVISLGSG